MAQTHHWRSFFSHLSTISGQFKEVASLFTGEFTRLKYLRPTVILIHMVVIVAQPFIMAAIAIVPWLESHLSRRVRLNVYVERADGAFTQHFRFSFPILLIQTPSIRLFLHWGSSVALLVLCTALPPAALDLDSETQTIAFWAMAIVLGQIASEVGELQNEGSYESLRLAFNAYISNEFNLADLFGLLLTVIALAGRLWLSYAGTGEDGLWFVQVMSWAVLLLGLRLLSVLYLTALGPFMLMVCIERQATRGRPASASQTLRNGVRPVPALQVFRMLVDVGRILYILGPLLLFFAAASHVLMKEALVRDTPEGCSVPGDPDAQASLHEDFGQSYLSAVVILLELVLGGEDMRLECLRSSVVGTSAWLIGILFAVVTLVLLLNMLIASMALTFQDIFDKRKLRCAPRSAAARRALVPRPQGDPCPHLHRAPAPCSCEQSSSRRHGGCLSSHRPSTSSACPCALASWCTPPFRSACALLRLQRPRRTLARPPRR